MVPRVQLVNKIIYISLRADTLEKCMNPIILHPLMNKIVGQTDFVTLAWQPVLKENSEFKSVVICFKKLTLCHILTVVEGLGKYIYLVVYMEKEKKLIIWESKSWSISSFLKRVSKRNPYKIFSRKKKKWMTYFYLFIFLLQRIWNPRK